MNHQIKIKVKCESALCGLVYWTSMDSSKCCKCLGTIREDMNTKEDYRWQKQINNQ